MSTFKKEERLKSQKQIGKLFENGESFLAYPLKVVYLITDVEGRFPAQSAFSVSKKNFKRAVKRNLLKRRIKEAYRLNKSDLYNQLGGKQLVLMFVYVAKDILPYPEIEKAIKKSISILIQRV